MAFSRFSSERVGMVAFVEGLRVRALSSSTLDEDEAIAKAGHPAWTAIRAHSLLLFTGWRELHRKTRWSRPQAA